MTRTLISKYIDAAAVNRGIFGKFYVVCGKCNSPFTTRRRLIVNNMPGNHIGCYCEKCGYWNIFELT